MSETIGAPPLPGLVLPAPSAPLESAPPSPAATAPAAAPVAWAGFWRRFWAYLLDGVIAWFLGVGLSVIVRVAAGVTIWPLWKESAQATPMLIMVELALDAIFGLAYRAGFESSQWQATPGKRALRLRVTDLAGRRISLGRAVARQFAMILSALTLGIGFLMAGFTRRRQALHDMVAGTLVIRDVRN